MVLINKDELELHKFTYVTSDFQKGWNMAIEAICEKIPPANAISPDTVIHITMKDDDGDEEYVKAMTVEEFLNTYTDEGCPPFLAPYPDKKVSE